MKKVNIFLCSFALIAQLYAGGGDDLSPKQKIQMADELYKKGSYYNAIEYYKSAASADPTNGRLAFKLAQANMQIRDYVQAEKWFKNAITSNAGDELALFNYGKVLKYNAKYDIAIEQFKKFKATFKGNSGYLQLADSEIQGAEMAKQAGSGLRAEMSNIGDAVNSPSTEFAPFAINENELLYSSFNVNKAVETGSNANVANFAKIYSSKRVDEKWQNGVELPSVVNASNFHNGNPSFSAKTNTLYFTRCVTNEDLKMICDVYASALNNGSTWGEAVKLSINAQGVNNTQPSIVPASDGSEYLLFVSERQGGKGGKDIWYAKGSGTNFTQPQNASKINTFGDETSPFFDKYDNTIYFSSDGHPNFGGLDIFSIKGTPENLGTPANVGMPINSNVDDFYFTVSPSGENAYIVSNRPGTTSLHSETCCDDIFEGVLIDRVKVNVKGSVTDIADGSAVNESTYELRKKNGNGEIVATQKIDGNKFDINVERGFDYELVTIKDGYEQGVSEFNTRGIKRSRTVEANVRMRKKAPDCKPIKERTVVSLEKLYFDFDKFDLTPMALAILQKNLGTLQKNADLVVELQSHTDGKGTDEYNIKLSENRTNTVFEWLKKNGIDASRLTSTYKGETMPEYPNTNPDGSDNPGGRQLNRRTEFIILK